MNLKLQKVLEDNRQLLQRDAPSGSLSREREIVDGTLQLCLEFPQNVGIRILFVQTLLAMKRARPTVAVEYQENARGSQTLCRPWRDSFWRAIDNPPINRWAIFFRPSGLEIAGGVKTSQLRDREPGVREEDWPVNELKLDFQEANHQIAGEGLVAAGDRAGAWHPLRDGGPLSRLSAKPATELPAGSELQKAPEKPVAIGDISDPTGVGRGLRIWTMAASHYRSKNQERPIKNLSWLPCRLLAPLPSSSGSKKGLGD